MKVGDMVAAIADVSSGFDVIGLICDEKLDDRREFYVIWSTISTPVGWWYEDALIPYGSNK